MFIQRAGLILALSLNFCAPTTSAAQTPAFFATDGTNNSIRVFGSAGEELPSILNPQFRFPTFLSQTIDGTSLITDVNFVGPSGPDLVRIDLSGNIQARATSHSIFGISGGGVVSVVDTGRRSLLITSTINTIIVETDYDFNVIRRIASNAPAGGLRTLGAAMSLDNSRLYVADADGQSGSGFIRIFDYLSGLQISAITNPVIQFPFELRFDRAGDLFISDRGASFSEDWIHEFFPDGTLGQTIRSGATSHANFGSFDILPDGRLLVLETNIPTQSPIRLLDSFGNLIIEFGPNDVQITDVLVAYAVTEPPIWMLLLIVCMPLIRRGGGPPLEMRRHPAYVPPGV